MERELAAVVSELIALGRDGAVRLSERLRATAETYRLLPANWGELKDFAAGLTEPQLRDLIRGLVLHSQAGGFSGGSVSPVVPLYRVYRERFPMHEPPLTAWIVENRINEYEPFGTVRHNDATSYELFLEQQAEALVEKRLQEDREELRQQEARAERGRVATGRLANAVRRGDLKAVKALIEQGADINQVLSAVGSLQALAKANGRQAVLDYLREMRID